MWDTKLHMFKVVYLIIVLSCYMSLYDVPNFIVLSLHLYFIY